MWSVDMRWQGRWLLRSATGAIEQVDPVLLVHGFPEVHLFQGTGIAQHLDIDADILATCLVKGVEERAPGDGGQPGKTGPFSPRQEPA